MNALREKDDAAMGAASRFREMVQSVGVKRFSDAMRLSTRQINRMLSGAQPNPVERLIRCMQASTPETGDEALSFVCQEAGGHFIKEAGPLDQASSNAVKECAEAIAAISDGQVTDVGVREVHEAISALTGLLQTVRRERGGGGSLNVTVRPVSSATSAPRRTPPSGY